MIWGKDIVVCFSGHRYYAAAAADEGRLAAAVEQAVGDGYRVFVSGMAPGFDLAAAEAVVRCRSERVRGADFSGGASGGGHSSDIRLVAAVPFARQAAGYSDVDRARYEALLAAADEVCVLAEGYSHGCYFRRDEWMVERASRLICWYDGGAGGSRASGASGSGTRYTVRRALAAGLDIVNVFRDPDTLF
ncbi:MAG: DUF1273 domain-containing protein [Alistipes sp.]|jgi:uncharacterized phage-like protein YoqJ|nr:DUF1273 domain-containing protein [Alistipes sp.]